MVKRKYVTVFEYIFDGNVSDMARHQQKVVGYSLFYWIFNALVILVLSYSLGYVVV